MTDDPQQLEPSPEFRDRARVRSRADYEALHRESLVDPEKLLVPRARRSARRLVERPRGRAPGRRVV